MLGFFNHRKTSKKRQNCNSRLLSMEVEVGLSAFVVNKDFLVVSGCAHRANSIKVD